jgi:hypothetical protein
LQITRLVEFGVFGPKEDEESEVPVEPVPRIRVLRNSVLLDVNFPSADEILAEGGTGCIDSIHIRINPPKSSVMGPKEEFIECCALICCSNLQCDLDMFTAINECGLVFDGGLVVNEHFRTTDSHIYAAGSFTRYSRKFRGEVDHDRINAKELGQYVAEEVISRHLTLHTSDMSENSRSVISDPYGPDIVKFPKFRAPKITDFRFPGGVHYFTSKLPDSSPLNTGNYMVTGPTDDSARRICALKVHATRANMQLF